MYNNDYENYMRSVLGYPIQNEMNTYDVYSSNSYFPYRYDTTNYDNTRKYEELYPDIYRILKPMIKKVCERQNYNEVSGDILDNMTNEIYSNIEQDIDVVNVNVTTTREAEKQESIQRKDFKVSQKDVKDEQTRAQCCKNPTLKDLIRILIIQQLLENNKHRPPRPPFGFRPPFPPRPPYRELENPSIYSNNYSSDQSYPYYN